MMWKRRTMKVNELLDLIIAHYECNTAVIKAVEVADIHNQRKPAELPVDFGGVLTLHIDVYEEPE